METKKHAGGRPKKSWKLFNPGRHWTGKAMARNSYAGARYWLWRPGHREHFLALVAPPTAPGDSWTERAAEPDTRYRYVRMPDGGALHAETIADYSALVKGERQHVPTIPPENDQ